MQDLIDSIIQGDSATENESKSDSESISDESSSNTDGSQTPGRNPNPMNPFQTPDSNHQANAVTIHTALA